MVLEEKECLDEGEDDVEHVYNSKDVTLTGGRVLCLEVGRDVEAI